ncbi:MAG: MoxR family ATPase [Planctomycetota bacterium]|nr:MoxR family ATPase [Planctomycetota bacterium]
MSTASTGVESNSESQSESDAVLFDQIQKGRIRLERELEKTIVGQKEVIEQLLICLFSGTHCLITGAPGLAKTLLVRSVAQAFHLDFSRVQFTPDLMPADITGTEILTDNEGRRELRFVPGPVFANVILADEINRTPPKTQSALLEAMQEHQVTAAGKRYGLPNPFFVLATQNPIEMEGTYPLPEAQLDRFMFNVLIDYLPFEDELKVVLDTTSRTSEPIEALFDGKDILQFQALVRKVPVARDVAAYAVRLVAATRPNQPQTPGWVNHAITWGAGLRAAQMLVLGAKARAILHGKTHVRYEDIRSLAPPVLRHRLLLSYKAEAEGMTVENVIQKLLGEIPSES